MACIFHFGYNIFVALLITCVCSIEDALSRSYAHKVDRPSVHLNSPDVKAGGHVIQERWPFVYSPDGMEGRKGDTIRRLGVRPPDVAMATLRVITKRRRDKRLKLLLGDQSSSSTTRTTTTRRLSRRHCFCSVSTKLARYL